MLSKHEYDYIYINSIVHGNEKSLHEKLDLLEKAFETEKITYKEWQDLQIVAMIIERNKAVQNDIHD